LIKIKETYRQRVARLLLFVFLLMQGVAAFHTHDHHAAEPICHECVQHLPHPGHLVDGPDHLDDCIICQLLAAPYLLPEPTPLAEAVTSIPLHSSLDYACAPSHEQMVPPLRAPPVSLS